MAQKKVWFITGASKGLGLALVKQLLKQGHAVAATHQKFGRLDVVVNNAGYGIGGAVEELSEQEINDSFSINVSAVINVTRAAMPFLRQQRSGHIINIASIAGFAPDTLRFSYQFFNG